ncbi:MAG: acyltransferase domain-containing protein [Desulfobacterales bacterium]|nr:acyltransferase domain-containing protein [Desulfobacterales bacterium]
MSTITEKNLGNLNPLQKAALAIKELRSKIDQLERAKNEPIAIIGMACRFPGAENSDAYWQLLANGREAIVEVPPDRWDVNELYDPNPNAAGKINTRWGGFIDKIDQFDAAFFGISPLEAEYLDPQQRIVLELVWHALEDAGIAPVSLRCSRTGVFVGITQNDYGDMQMGGSLEGIKAYTGTGSGHCFAAGRIAFIFGFNGPTFSVDTACSSSMVAMYQACLSLRNGDCDIAIVAGTHLILTPAMQVFLSKTQAFSPDGRCFTFDERANGFVNGEGMAVVVLCRKSLALERGDTIHALICSSSINHDGPSSGITVPNEAAQEALMREALAKANLTPADIDYIEAHGTATPLGDPIEVGAIQSVYGHTPRKKPLLLGSVKANIGHLNACSGIAALIKVVLMLKNQKLIPQPNFKSASKKIAWENFPINVSTQLTDWPQMDRPRRAGINSFSLSGTNVHFILEEHLAVTDDIPETGLDRNLHVLTLSGRNETALIDLARSFQTYIFENAAKQINLSNLCFSANTGRNHFKHRLAISASSVSDLQKRLEFFINKSAESESVKGIWQDFIPKSGIGRIAYGLTDDVSVDMLRFMANTQPKLASVLEQCQTLAKTYLHSDLFVQPYTKAAKFSCQYALIELWRSFGIKPAIVFGSGVGELTANCCAGMYDLEQAFQMLAGKEVQTNAPLIKVVKSSRDIDANEYKIRLALGTEDSLQKAGVKYAVDVPSKIDFQNTSDWLPILKVDLENPWEWTVSLLAALYVKGVDVDWTGFDAGYARKKLRIPNYPFQRKRFWLESLETKKQAETVTIDAKPELPKIKPEITHEQTSVQDVISTPATSVYGTAPVDIARLLNNQMESATSLINNVVDQQLAFLKRALSTQQIASQQSVAPTVLPKPEPEPVQQHEQKPLSVKPSEPEPVKPVQLDKSEVKTASTAKTDSKLSLIMMFPGVGDHYLNMGLGLYQHEPVFKSAIDKCCEFLKPELGLDLRTVLYPVSTTDKEVPKTETKPAPRLDFKAMLGRGSTAGNAPNPPNPDEERLNRTIHSQPIVFIIEYALGCMWLSRGLKPEALVGYSIGEYIAACLAQVMSLEDSLTLVTRRAKLIEQLPKGVMLAVPMSEAKIKPMLGEKLSLAIVSTVNQCIVGGPAEAIAELEKNLLAQEIVSRRLPGTHAFHSKMMTPLQESIIELVKSFKLNAPQIPYLSNVTGNWISEKEATDPVCWAKHTYQTVRFADCLEKLLDQEGRIFLETGPGQSLGSFVLQHPRAFKLQDKIVLPSLRNRYERLDDGQFLKNTVEKLKLAGLELN